MVQGLNQAVFSSVLEQISDITLREKKLDYLCTCKSEIGNVSNTVEDHCLQAIKIVHHHTNGRFDWLISGHQSVNLSREVISMLSGKYKTFMFAVQPPNHWASGDHYINNSTY